MGLYPDQLKHGSIRKSPSQERLRGYTALSGSFLTCFYAITRLERTERSYWLVRFPSFLRAKCDIRSSDRVRPFKAIGRADSGVERMGSDGMGFVLHLSDTGRKVACSFQ